ncbi:MAG: hypothetical protein ACR2PS_18275, partial [Pseudomonadales bacterium]
MNKVVKSVVGYASLTMVGCSTLSNLAAVRSFETSLADSTPSDTTITSVTSDRDSQGRQARLVSAFYGLDDDLPKRSNSIICAGAGSKDGMP